ncbi:MAG: hypothetical protein ISR69_11720 [Gammaproteobacteria bacterium]|nr:hypothetical protein [Gammaproteobacteria bacterium]
MENITGNTDQESDKIARRYDNRQGYDLIDYREVGLPYYKIMVVTLFQVRKPISPIEEFILKAINLGLESADSISGFLGLDQNTTLDAMSSLRINENIDLLSNLSGQQTWKITKKGGISLRDATTRVPDVRTISIYFDGLLRSICTKNHWDLLKPKEIQNRNILEVSPFPSRPPELSELQPKEADEVIRRLEKQSKRKKEQDLIAFKSIERRERLYQPALALIYKAKDKSDEIQVSFAIDGILSSEHEDAFARSGQIGKLRISEQLQNQQDIPEVLARNVFGNAIIEQVKQTDELTKELLICQQKIEHTRLQPTDFNDANKKLEQRIKELEKEIADKPNKSKILRMYEHRPLLEKALSESKTRLLIISPWIRANATNNDFIDRLENLLKRRVTVYIGYGFGDEKDQKRDDIKAEQFIQNLADRYSNFHLKRLGDTHAKILISDNNYAVVTSFNWLSFKGDAKLKFRDERGMMAYDNEEIERLFTDYSEKICKFDNKPMTR